MKGDYYRPVCCVACHRIFNAGRNWAFREARHLARCFGTYNTHAHLPRVIVMERGKLRIKVVTHCIQNNIK